MAEENDNNSGSDDAVAAAEIAAKAASDAAIAEAAAKLAKPKLSAEDQTLVEKLVQERLDADLAKIKKSLDGAYQQRDELKAKVIAFEAKEREMTLKRLNEEGKFKEAYELQLSEERAANAALAKQNMELSRDVSVREALRSYAFKNDKAAEMAFKEITSNLVQNESKQWVHRSGITVKEYCDAFSKDEDQSFLYKVKTNSGAGVAATTSGSGNPNSTNKPTSLFNLPQAEVLKMAAEGKFGARPSF